MHQRSLKKRTLTCLATLSLLKTTCLAQLYIFDEPGWQSSVIMGVAQDGTAIGYWSESSDHDSHTFSWNRRTGFSWHGQGSLNSISYDGSTIFGTNPDETKFRLRDGVKVNLGNVGVNVTNSTGTFAAGFVTRNRVNALPTLWSEQYGFEVLGDLPYNATAIGVSDDGNSVLISRQGPPFLLSKWSRSTHSYREIAEKNEYTASTMTPDASTVFFSNGRSSELKRWTETGGIVGLGFEMESPMDSTPDGSIVVGGQEFQSGSIDGRIFFEGLGGYDVDDWLASYGIQFPGQFGQKTLNSVAVNGDSVMVSGYGYYFRNGEWLRRGFVAIVPEPSSFFSVCFGAAWLWGIRRRHKVGH